LPGLNRACCALHKNRQAYRTLRALLGYEPTSVPAGEPGYGAGSGAPDIMFGFLKHLWATQSRQHALLRCVGVLLGLLC
jgi:FKBP12-rapamycin complex-associated protein